MVVATPLPACRRDLVIRPLGDDGRYVVKDPRNVEFFQLGEREHFLLTQLDGERTTDEVCTDYTAKFGESLSETGLDEFIETARSQGLLQSANGVALPEHKLTTFVRLGSQTRQSILYWRKSFWDPDRLFTWLAPELSFFWSRPFLILSLGCIVLASLLVWSNRNELAASFSYALRWETAVLVWLTLFVVTMLHECAHGLTCKHYGGEVHEIGFLLMYLMPCFYCNVSDAWLFREKSKRLWVTFAGGYFELFLWALAVFVWRLTPAGTGLNYLAFIVISVCGIQTLFNFNPLLKLDGYYLLSDWLEIPNLQQRALGRFKGGVRRRLWGSPALDHEPRRRLLLGFGLATWLYSLIFLCLALAASFQFLGTRWGWAGIGGIGLVGFVGARTLFRDFSNGEVSNMIRLRHKRTIVWLLVLCGLAAALRFIEIEDRAGGEFLVRPLTRAEIRAPVAGFLREVYCDEGDRISVGTPVARLEVLDLASRLARKRAEVQEAQAKLRLLEAGPRPDVVTEQRRRVERATAWHELGRQDLARLREVCEKELARLDKLVVQCQAEVTAAQDSARRARSLAGMALSTEQLQEAERKHQVCRALLEQAQAERHIRVAKGALEAETELARRARDVADVQATLTLLEAPPRAEEVDAERARLARLQEEERYLDQLQEKLPVYSPVPGLVTTPRLKEKVGQFLREGELICMVEGAVGLEVEITLAEQDVARVQTEQAVGLRARALPFDTLSAEVIRIAPAAGRGDVQSTVTVYCQLAGDSSGLRSGMTGYARIYTGPRPIGDILADRALRWLRTEFWWW